MQDNRVLDIVGEFYSDGMVPVGNMPTEHEVEDGDGPHNTVRNGNDADIFALLELLQDEINSPLPHYHLREDLVHQFSSW